MNALAMRARIEHFGAWVRIADDTLVAVDRERARRLGLDGGEVWGEIPGEPDALEVHVAVTRRCPVSCSGCYQSATAEGEHVARESIDATLRELSERGVFTVAFGGGEPMLRDDIGDLAGSARAVGLVPVLTTSGIGVDRSKAKGLRDFAQVNVSHDGTRGGYRAVRGFEGAQLAERAITALSQEGIPVGVNVVLTRQSLDGLAETVRHLKALGAREVQLLRYKPAGRAASLDYLTRRLSPAQVEALGSMLRALVDEHGDSLSIRVDCALVPLLAETLGPAELLERFGVFGCEAGRHLAAKRADGQETPCSFVTEAPSADRDRRAFLDFVERPPEPCRSCDWRSVCRGGCKVVSLHLDGAMTPDPECPRVRRHGSARDP